MGEFKAQERVLWQLITFFFVLNKMWKFKYMCMILPLPNDFGRCSLYACILLLGLILATLPGANVFVAYSYQQPQRTDKIGDDALRSWAYENQRTADGDVIRDCHLMSRSECRPTTSELMLF